MIRSGTTVAGALSALLALGVMGSASAQSAQPSDQGTSAQQQQQQETQQERFDREKVTLKDEVQAQISSADAQIDALKNMGKNEKGQTKKQNDDMQKQLSDLRDHLKKDLDKIDKSSQNDWSGVQPVVQRDLMAMNAQLQRVAAITKVPVPPTGAANKQAPNQ